MHQPVLVFKMFPNKPNIGNPPKCIDIKNIHTAVSIVPFLLCVMVSCEASFVYLQTAHMASTQ